MEYPKIESEEQYWKELKKWKKSFPKKKEFFSNPYTYVELLCEKLKEGVKRQLITEEFAQEKIEKIYEEVCSPINFKMSAVDKKDRLKNKIKEYFGKDVNLKK
ncbi:MAG: hypothetical protein ACOC56_02045 [Atribacterota bacterium]